MYPGENTFVVQGARRRHCNAAIHVGRRRLFAEKKFGKRKKYFLDEIKIFPLTKYYFLNSMLPMEF
jgi:hypothetical protein